MVGRTEPVVAEQAQYRFEPLDRRGLLLGLGAGQLAVAAAALVLSLAAVNRWPGLLGFTAAAAMVAVAVALCRPLCGKPPTQWVAVATRFVARRRTVISRPPRHNPGKPGHNTTGQGHDAGGPVAAPEALTTKADRLRGRREVAPALKFPTKTFAPGTYLCELAATPDDGALGALIDEHQGTAAALLRARGAAFCLLDGPDKARRLAAWAAVLESLAGRRSSLARLQWCQRSLPGDSHALLAHLRRAGQPQRPGFAGHAALLERAGERSWRHETLLVVVVRCRSRRGRPSEEGAAALRAEVRSLRSQMHSVGLVCEGLLDAVSVARALGDGLVPGLPAAPRAYPWPLAFRETWSDVRADGLWHRTYWVAEWPRSRVGPDFLSPLLMGQGRRSFSVVMAPVPAERAIRDAESARTAQLADSHLRAQGGFLETAQHRRQAEAVEGREAELADGRAAFELSGYVTVSAGDRPALEQACSQMERAAAAARLCVRPLYGQQKEALMWSLPLGRGL